MGSTLINETLELPSVWTVTKQQSWPPRTALPVHNTNIHPAHIHQVTACHTFGTLCWMYDRTTVV